jgi:glycosyltransferase involved in cell wall biosynthesis
MQQPAKLPELDARIEVRIGNLPSVAELWNEGDVAVQPSKLEGMGFMVLEPVCAGLPVITLNAAPMNEYAAMIKAPVQWLSRRGFATQWAPHARLRPARIGALAQAMEQCTQMDLGEASRRQRAWAEEQFNRETLRAAWSSVLAPLLRNRSVAA